MDGDAWVVVIGAMWGWRGGELMEKYSGAPCEVRISREGLLAAPIICMYYVKLRRQLPCELSKALQWEAEPELLRSCHLHSLGNEQRAERSQMLELSVGSASSEPRG